MTYAITGTTLFHEETDQVVPDLPGNITLNQGNLTARGQHAELKLHTYEMAGYQFDPRGILLLASGRSCGVRMCTHANLKAFHSLFGYFLL